MSVQNSGYSLAMESCRYRSKQCSPCQMLIVASLIVVCMPDVTLYTSCDDFGPLMIEIFAAGMVALGFGAANVCCNRHCRQVSKRSVGMATKSQVNFFLKKIAMLTKKKTAGCSCCQLQGKKRQVFECMR
ncbi:hypothetical protein GOP47_0011904 [Adiantum capillus-veneris]|uniref:Uncharacterized protein n=1 Tax=Adiantum capillus-veneris TaxID=13818 RepID=A0A9D4UU48_ADICA|nr:hypothetical protein GOP47_0011904 [Adiantum capillus-veneris]